MTMVPHKVSTRFESLAYSFTDREVKAVVDALSFEYRWLRRVTHHIPSVKEQPPVYKASSIQK